MWETLQLLEINLFAYASLHFTGITTNFTGTFFCFFSVRQIRFMSKFNVHVCHWKKYNSQCFTNNALWCCTNSKRAALARLTVRSGSDHILSLFSTVIEFSSFVQTGLLCIETWNLWNEVEKELLKLYTQINVNIYRTFMYLVVLICATIQ